MPTAIYKVPIPKNEPVNSYAPGTPQRASLQAKIKELRAQEVDVPMYIGAEEVRTGKTHPLNPPHDHQHKLGQFHEGDGSHVEQAIKAALAAKQDWADLPWQQRASVFLKAADLISGPYRDKINAATMLAQSKNAYQAEIDSACELADFLRFNVKYMTEIYEEQPFSPDGVWNKMEYRPLEGFVFALTPFNFTAIAGNLPSSAALMGNTVVWKPAYSQIYSANVVMEIFREAGVPDGVINLIYVDGPTTGEKIFKHPDFAGIHFTGSTGVFQNIWKTIGENIETYKSYPRIVGETGGKDFILAHKTADAKQVATAITRGAFEFQGQKCSAASRVYVANNIWDEVKENLVADIKDIKMGGPEDFENFFNAVIDRKAFDKIKGYIETAKESNVAEVIAGGECDDSKGYFIQPTVIVTKDPQFVTMQEEIFGPVVTIYVYDAENFEETLTLVDETSPYALTGAIFSNDRYIIERATKRLSQAAGNFYINDKPTGAVVNQNPFGGARKSGTNDKAGSKLNLLRWCSARMVKETFVTPTDYKYPFMGE
ncbi:L-glutamate gamma-semialdehyde dehydrogenase [Marivirga harenae]|uniref:L-glutamate gamma-semialdehyde dehydrogenase n=1 Tax=Marivirga harenae TaxID=2010992 RepID=UPI0026DFC01F|nr:L-glutamate gamma-semialdehyde dehydrogenase [Marivirga harenae]WKV12499.1 L-glutamate gamma-semialdehyde dehydrogenase [Marivirga harenae]|tara:strand:- start:23062 stop:24690 length:1629 start_codon:yes stop_codon:yes gene_type:complete